MDSKEKKFIAISNVPTDLNTWLMKYAERKYYRKGTKSFLIIEVLQEYREKHLNDYSDL